MILAGELAGAFLAGVAVTLAAVPLAARWYVRRKFGGMVDLLGLTPKR